MRSPFVKLKILSNDYDLSDTVKSIRFEDSSEEDSMTEIRIKAEYSLELLENKNVRRNSLINFQIGYLGDESSPIHKGQIQDIDASYGDTVELTLRVKDLGVSLKKVTSIKIWNGVKSEDIVKTIADRYDMEYEVDSSTKVWNNVPQGHKSDFEFLSWLAERETDGNFIFYIRGSKLYFIRRGLNTESLLTYTYGDGKIISFKPRERETTKDKDAEGVSVASVDALTGKENGASSKEEKNGISTGTEMYVYKAPNTKYGKSYIKTDPTENKDGFNILDKIFDCVSKFGSNKLTPSADTVENTNISNSKKKKASLDGMTADLVVEGNPYLLPNKIVTIGNVAKRHSGNWFVTKVTHNIDATGNYTTTLGLKKNAGKVGDKKTTNPVNSKAGKDDANGKVKTPIHKVYDANTKILANRDGNNYMPPK